MPPTPQSLAALPLAPAVYLILIALAEEEAHGYRLRQAVIERSGGAVRLDPGSLYRMVGRLLDEHLIREVDARETETSDERRRYYGLTPAGRRILRDETSRLAELVTAAQAVVGKRAQRA